MTHETRERLEAAAEILTRAAAGVTEASWAQGVLSSEHDGKIRYCGAGHLRMAAFGDIDHLGRKYRGPVMEAYFTALDAVVECLPDRHRTLPSFNDAPTATAGAVRALFIEASGELVARVHQMETRERMGRREMAR